jgi:AcrR family transcriptional regulator
MTPDESIRTQSRIIDVAARLFSTYGVDSISVARVLAEIGQSHGGFYHRFRNKDALAAEACRRLFLQLSEQLSQNPRVGLGTLLPPNIPGIRSIALISIDVARSAPSSELHEAYQHGMQSLTSQLERQLDVPPVQAEATLATALGTAILQEALRVKPKMSHA